MDFRYELGTYRHPSITELEKYITTLTALMRREQNDEIARRCLTDRREFLADRDNPIPGEKQDYAHPQKCRRKKRPHLVVAKVKEDLPQLPLPPPFPPRVAFHVLHRPFSNAGLKLTEYCFGTAFFDSQRGIDRTMKSHTITSKPCYRE